MSHLNEAAGTMGPDAALQAVEERVRDLADHVSERPWASVGIAFAVGSLIGLVDRRGGLVGGTLFALAMKAARSYAFDELGERVKVWLASATVPSSLALISAPSAQETAAPARRKKGARRSKRARHPKA